METPMRHKNGLTTSLHFFLKMAKIWVDRTTLDGKKRGWPKDNFRNTLFHIFGFYGKRPFSAKRVAWRCCSTKQIPFR